MQVSVPNARVGNKEVQIKHFEDLLVLTFQKFSSWVVRSLDAQLMAGERMGGWVVVVVVLR